MGRLHICNTFFEQELESNQKIDLSCKASLQLKKWFLAHPAMIQLQYLPLLYAQAEDRILVSSLPENPDPRLVCIDEEIPRLPVESWGASSSINRLAKEFNLPLKSPSIAIVRQIQSKNFAYIQRPHLPKSALLSSAAEVKQWIEQTEGPKVLKRVLGVAGQGHFFPDQKRNLTKFIQREFSQGRPIIGEPWLDRKFDFSSQWEIGDEIELKGFTAFETSDSGSYSATIAGPVNKLFSDYPWAIDSHLEVALPILQKIKSMGFFGSLGVDAFVYGDKVLYPVVEINARKTMSRIALQIQQQRCANRCLRMSFESKIGGLLPGDFNRNIFLKDGG